MGYILPSKNCCPLNYMMQILAGQKVGLKIKPDPTSFEYKPHLESLHLEEARMIDWLDYLLYFQNGRSLFLTYL